jgi:hypothetical protein
MNPGFGFGGGGFGRGRGGGGRGRRNWFYATGLTGWQRAAMGWPPGNVAGPYAAPFAGAQLGKEQEMELLKKQSEMLQAQLDEVKQRLAELETADSAK